MGGVYKMKKIAAVESFFSPEHRVTLEKTAAECGFAVDYYPEGHLPADRAAEYEVIYGLCPPSELKAAANLKWFCCSFAGVDAYMNEDIYPSKDVCSPTPPAPTASPFPSTSSW